MSLLSSFATRMTLPEAPADRGLARLAPAAPFHLAALADIVPSIEDPMRYFQTDNIGAAKPDERFPTHAGDQRTINYRHIAYAPAAGQRHIHHMIIRARLERIQQLLAQVLGHYVHAKTDSHLRRQKRVCRAR